MFHNPAGDDCILGGWLDPMDTRNCDVWKTAFNFLNGIT